jgi:large subunit ribosomal protein L3
MKHIIAKKLEMSQRHREDGTVVPVTLLEAGPCVVTQVRTEDKDGYSAVQIGFGKAKSANKPLTGHVKASGLAAPSVLREFRVDADYGLKVGDMLDVSQFAVGQRVNVIATSKGKGFQGVVKRHGFRGGPASHGHKDNLRMPGSIGAGGIQRVFKGMRMGGRMGGDRVTVKNLEIIEVDASRNIIAVKGAVPGARGATVLVSGGYDKRQTWN